MKSNSHEADRINKKSESTFLKGKIEYVKFNAGEFVIHQGEAPLFLHIMLEGKVKAFHTYSKGQRFLFGIFDDPRLHGHLEIPNNDPFFNSVECLCKCFFIKMRKEVFIDWVKSGPEFAPQTVCL